MFPNRKFWRITLGILTLALVLSALGFVAAQDNAPPYLGITLGTSDSGAKVDGVMPGSPADAAGLKAGDIITAVEGNNVTSDSLRDLISKHAAGDTINLSITRNNETLDLSATLATRPSASSANVQPFQTPSERPIIGVNLENTDNGPTIREVSANSGAEKAGLMVGDIIKKIGDTDVKDAQSAADAVRALKVGDTVKVEIERDGKTQTVDVTLGGTTEMQLPQFGNRLGIGYNANDKTWQISGLPETSELYKAGLRSGDVISLFDGKAYDPAELQTYLKDAGSKDIALTVKRDGKEQEIKVAASALNALNAFNFDFGGDFNGGQFPFQMPFAQMMGGVRLGVEFISLDANTAKEHNVNETDGALVTQVVAGTPAEKAGLKVNDVITAVDGDKVDQEHTLRDRLVAYEAGDTIKLDVVRGGEKMQIEATLEQVAMSDFMPFFGGNGNGFQFHFPIPQQQQPVDPSGPRV